MTFNDVPQGNQNNTDSQTQKPLPFEKNQSDESIINSSDLPVGWKRFRYKNGRIKQDYCIVTNLGVRLRSQVAVNTYTQYHHLRDVSLKPINLSHVTENLDDTELLQNPVIENKAKHSQNLSEESINNTTIEEINMINIEDNAREQEVEEVIDNKETENYFYIMKEGDDIDVVINMCMERKGREWA